MMLLLKLEEIVIKFNFDVSSDDYNSYKLKVDEIRSDFRENGKMSDWAYLDKCVSSDEIKHIKELANDVRSSAEVFVVIGIGGSFLGSKAIIEALSPTYNRKPEIIYAGTNLSTFEINEIFDYIKDKSIFVNVISKSGSTLETSVTFDLFLDFMKSKYDNNELKKRIIVTTDIEKSDLLKVKDEYDLELLRVPENIGGRFSVLSPVGLFPIAVMGIDVDKLLMGAENASHDKENVLKYTIIRDKCYNSGKFVELFTIYQEKLAYFNEWLKQLFAESQGKNKKGILPVSIINTRDLHSMGQYIQDGKDVMFETVIFANEEDNIFIDKYKKSLNEINFIAMKSVVKAHSHMTSNIIEIDTINEENLGYLIYFFEKSCMLGSYLLNTNYYDQPGVNNYKEILLEELNREV